jgi:uncharacterized membrane protein
MDPKISELLNLLFRWIHVVSGVLWIGHLWFFNFVNAQVAKTYDADSKKKVVPELMPRALFWFRWGAVFTWVSGVFLLGLVYYMYTEKGGLLVDLDKGQSPAVAITVGLVGLVVAWVVYDLLWKQLAKNELVGGIVSFVLISAVAFGLGMIMSGRAVFIHLGGIFGTIMFANVWMRIWPNQRKIISATKAGTPPPDGAVPMAGLRSKHNTYMSVPLIFFMISNHYTIYNDDLRWIWAAVFIAVGWGTVNRLYVLSSKPSTAQF